MHSVVHTCVCTYMWMLEDNFASHSSGVACNGFAAGPQQLAAGLRPCGRSSKEGGWSPAMWQLAGPRRAVWTGGVWEEQR